MARPLISFCLLTYNQEEFVEDALRSAFRQTYQPLEIIVYDDFSSDSTPRRIRALVDGYAGPHRVTYGRAAANSGLGASVNAVSRMAASDLLVLAAGDDMSADDRVEELVSAGQTGARPPMCLFSGYEMVDQAGTHLRFCGHAGMSGNSGETVQVRRDAGDFAISRSPAVFGCSSAWNKELFRFFGPLRSDVEDLVLTFRALGIGDVIYVDKPLVKYRRHGTNMSFTLGVEGMPGFEEREKRLLMVNRWMAAVCANILADAGTLRERDLLDSQGYDRVLHAVRRDKWKYEYKDTMESGRLSKKLAMSLDAIRLGNTRELVNAVGRRMPRELRRVEYECVKWWLNWKRRRTLPRHATDG